MLRIAATASVLAGLLFLFACGGATQAAEQPSLELYPTFNAVGLEIAYGAPGQAPPQASFTWRLKGAEKWNNGVDMTADAKRGLLWASIWPLEEGQEVEVRIALGAATIEGSAATKSMTFPAPAAVYYVSPEGDDAADGSREKPFRTLRHASTVVKAGEAVHALSGVYHEGDLFAKLAGAPGRPIVFAAADGHSPVIDGSVLIPRGHAGWTQVADGLFATDFTTHTGYAGYVAQDGLRMYLLRERAAIDAADPESARAWFFDKDAGRLYVRTGDASAPADHDYNVAVFETGADFAGSSNVVLQGFQMRFFGVNAVRVTAGSADCVILSNQISNVPVGVALRDASTTGTAVWRNSMREFGLVDFSWNAIKRSGYGRQGLVGSAGRGTSICYNFFDGWFDGTAPVSWLNPDAIELNRDMDIMYNEFINIGDDAIEVDGGGVNQRIHANRMRNVFAAISLAPIERGPVYVTRNHASYKFIMFKLNVGGCTSLGWAYIYHNSGYCQMTGEGWGGNAFSFPPPDSIPIDNKVFLNNATTAKTEGIRYAHDGYTIDYNCFYHVPGGSPLIFTRSVKDAEGNWKREDYRSLEEYSAATGFEKNGIYADPLFVSMPDAASVVMGDFGPTPLSAFPLVPDASIGDLRLMPASPCIDAGVVIRGVNEDFLGKAPDMGAYEYAAPQ